MLRDVLDVDTIVLKSTISFHLSILLPGPLGEPVVLGDEDLLTSGELELGSSQSLDDLILEFVVGSDRDEDLTNLHAGSSSMSLAEGSSHSSLESVSSSA